MYIYYNSRYVQENVVFIASIHKDWNFYNKKFKFYI